MVFLHIYINTVSNCRRACSCFCYQPKSPFG
ncbi:AgrD family cyclic lactone autoinducer peptide [Dysgonomonas sp. HDW5A]